MSDPVATLPIELLNFQVIQPNEDHISLYFAHLAWAIEGKDPREEDQIGFIPPQVSRTFLECLDLEIKEDEHVLCIERCKQLAQRMLQIKKLVLDDQALSLALRRYRDGRLVERPGASPGLRHDLALCRPNQWHRGSRL